MLGCLDFSVSKRRDKAMIFSLHICVICRRRYCHEPPQTNVFKTVSQRTEVRHLCRSGHQFIFPG